MEDSNQPTIQQWEYLRQFTNMETVGVDEFLNSLGFYGWELVCTVPNHHGTYYIFKRQIINTNDH